MQWLTQGYRHYHTVIHKGVVFRGEDGRTLPVFEENLLPKWLLRSIIDERSLPAEVMVAGCETFDSDADETGSIQLS